MCPLVSVTEAARARLNECTHALTDKFLTSVRPVYRVRAVGQRLPEHIGSCVLLNIGGYKCVVTAAHVADNRESTALYMAGGLYTELVQIVGDVHATPKPQGNRNKDPYDFAIWHLTDDVAATLGNAQYITEESICANRAKIDGRVYLALGYPVSKNKRLNMAQSSIPPAPYSYTTNAKEDDVLAATLGVTGNDHFFLAREKRSRDAQGQIVDSVKPVGLSGGALIDLGQLGRPENLSPLSPCTGYLAGILIENRSQRKALVAVKIQLILEHISVQRALLD